MSIEIAHDNLRRWRANGADYVREVFGVEPDEWQLEVLSAFSSEDKDKMRISMQACAGPGKSAVLAWCGWLFLSCYGARGEHPKGVVISVTADNLADNLWPEFSKWQSRSEWLMKTFTWTKSRIFANDHPETWFLSARSYAKTANAEEQGRTMSGLHSKYVLILVDESGDIPIPVMKAGEQALGNCIFGKALQAGNPTSHGGMLYAAASKLRHLWHVIRITGDPLDPKRSPRIDLDWAKQQIETYGRTDPWVMSMILGEFPLNSINTLLSIEEVEAAVGRYVPIDSYDHIQKRLGVDVARFGDDRTVIFPRQGLIAHNPVIMRGARNPDIAARVMMAKNKWGSELEFVDGTGGYGGGVVDSLRQTGCAPFEYQASGSPTSPKFYNKRAEVWFSMAEWIKKGGSLPKEFGDELIRELSGPTYTFKDGKFLLEPKDSLKKRLGVSPDLADALSMTFALVDLPASMKHLGFKDDRGTLVSDWDPFAERD